MGDWVRAFVGIFFLLYFFFFFLLFYDTRLVDGLTYSFPFSLFQLSIFFVTISSNCSCPIYYYVGCFPYSAYSGSREWLVRNLKVK